MLQRSADLEREVARLVYKLELREGELKMMRQAATRTEDLVTVEARHTQLARAETAQTEIQLATAKSALALLQGEWSAKSSSEAVSKLSVAQLSELR